MFNRYLFSSQSFDWNTPKSIFDKLNSEFHFTLDPCASVSNHLCEKYFTIDQNGLDKDWSGEVVFCNPPYNRQLYKWIQKGFYSNCVSVFLVPARTDTKWFHDFVLYHSEIRFIKGRLRFNGSDQNAPFPSMIVIFRNCFID